MYILSVDVICLPLRPVSSSLTRWVRCCRLLYLRYNHVLQCQPLACLATLKGVLNFFSADRVHTKSHYSYPVLPLHAQRQHNSASCTIHATRGTLTHFHYIGSVPPRPSNPSLSVVQCNTCMAVKFQSGNMNISQPFMTIWSISTLKHIRTVLNFLRISFDTIVAVTVHARGL